MQAKKKQKQKSSNVPHQVCFQGQLYGSRKIQTCCTDCFSRLIKSRDRKSPRDAEPKRTSLRRVCVEKQTVKKIISLDAVDGDGFKVGTGRLSLEKGVVRAAYKVVKFLVRRFWSTGCGRVGKHGESR